jgi:cytochrome c1
MKISTKYPVLMFLILVTWVSILLIRKLWKRIFK